MFYPVITPRFSKLKEKTKKNYFNHNSWVIILIAILFSSKLRLIYGILCDCYCYRMNNEVFYRSRKILHLSYWICSKANMTIKKNLASISLCQLNSNFISIKFWQVLWSSLEIWSSCFICQPLNFCFLLSSFHFSAHGGVFWYFGSLVNVWYSSNT